MRPETLEERARRCEHSLEYQIKHNLLDDQVKMYCTLSQEAPCKYLAFNKEAEKIYKRCYNPREADNGTSK